MNTPDNEGDSALMRIAQANSRAAVRLTTQLTTFTPKRIPRDGWVDLLTIDLDASLLVQCGMPADPMKLTLAVALTWLDVPTARPQESCHRVAFTSPAGGVPAEATLFEHRTELVIEESLPTSYDLARLGYDATEDEALDLDETLFTRAETGVPIHQVFGYASPQQGDVWASVDEDLRFAGEAELHSSFTAKAHRLLFQVDTDDSIGLQIADGGRLFVLISDEDLALRRFDRTVAAIHSA